MTDWPEIAKRYPMPAEHLSARPWWHREVTSRMTGTFVLGEEYRLVRTDGRSGDTVFAWSYNDSTERTAGRRATEIADVDRIDCEHPLPAPLPACGQVWAWPSTGDEVMLVGRTATGWEPRLVIEGRTVVGGGDAPWPPPGAVLVAGPGAPWQGGKTP